MGYQRDQNYHPQTFRRQASANDPSSALPPPYVEAEKEDPAADTSIPAIALPVAHPSTHDGERKVLLVYVHGFMGNETSFQGFPRDVHDASCQRLDGICTVHSLIYPKYKSRKKIEFARDELIGWLQQRLSSNTDVILLGHSMGGLLTAEVALLSHQQGFPDSLQGHILGTVNLDVPFLGMHPGIVASGISSLFRSAPEQLDVPTQEERRQDIGEEASRSNVALSAATGATLAAGKSVSVGSASHQTDTSSHPASPGSTFPEVSSAPAQSTWSKAFYFMNKHSGDLTKATKSYFTSHLEFGGCMADYKGLMHRYSRLRALEDDRRSRIRFVNYYSASTGWPKKNKKKSIDSKTHPGESDANANVLMREVRNLELEATQSSSLSLTSSKARSSLGDSSLDEGITSTDRARDRSSTSQIDLVRQAPEALPEEPLSTVEPSNIESADTLPPLPDPPKEPPSFKPSIYTDKDTRKLASKDHDRQLKSYQRALKDRDKAIKDRRKLLAKRAQLAKNEEGRAPKTKSKGKDKDKQPASKESIAPNNELEPLDSEHTASLPSISTPSPPSRPPPLVPTSTASSSSSQDRPSKPPASPEPKPPKHHHFCFLPPKKNGERDPCWIRVFMPGVDEVTAHCGLFVAGSEHYGWLVGDVVERIGGWVEAKGRERR